ncbi:MAG: Rrf2 family transcriptional regulator [Firmicutes bacterium]|nr:Rrf2 family transcriptional regulator [Bacillota bacterium]
MKMSTKGRYGLRAMVDIAVNCGKGECVSLKSVANRQNLSESYLEQLISPLKKAGIVKSTRGAQGGYVLAKSAADITVGEILRALEGPLDIVECDKGTASCGSASCKNCVTKNVWEKLSESVNETADSITLEMLARQSMSQD